MQAALLALLLARPDATTLESHYGRLETDRRIYRPLDRVRVSVTGRAGGGRQILQGAGDVVQRVGVEGEHPGPGRQSGHGLLGRADGHGADVADGLGQHQVRPEGGQPIRIDLVDAAVGLHRAADGGVDLGAAQARRVEARSADAGPIEHLGRVVALV